MENEIFKKLLPYSQENDIKNGYLHRKPSRSLYYKTHIQSLKLP